MPERPSAYVEGYATARLWDQSQADNYIKHTTIGDAVLDPVMEELSSLPPADLHRFIEAGIEHEEGLRDAPQALRDFFKDLEEPPWLDYQAFRPGILVFNENVQLMLVAFVTGVLVEGFSTLIAKSFNITKRVASSDRRLKQNNRQLMEIFYPGGLRRDGDGWKLSTRVRFVHARIRNLLANALIQSIPVVAGITDPAEKEKVITLAYRLSRALLGNTLADQFQYPKGLNIGTLFLFRNKQRLQRWFKRWFKQGGIRSDNFSQMLQISVYDEGGLSYKMPDHVYASKSSPW